VRFAAVDLGASSGRVMAADVGPDTLALREAHRFPNEPVRVGGSLHWDVLRLFHEILAGLRVLGGDPSGGGPPVSIGVDSWAIDYGLLDAAGELLGNPFAYRDGRTDGVADRVHEMLPFAELYRRTGLQYLPFTTIYQLAAEPRERLAAAKRLLLVPDLVTYWLTGQAGTEVTNASTTGLLDVTTGTWSPEVLAAIGVPADLLPPLRRPGDVAGPLLAGVAAETGLPPDTTVVAVGSHDTASSVVAVPAADDEFAYISCGTWSLVGVELDAPVLTAESRAANFTNEGGVDGRVRYLRNVMGLWLLQECLRTWKRAGSPGGGGPRLPALPDLLAAADALPPGPVIDPDDARFLPPGDMPARIAAACREADLPEPPTPAHVVRCILDSLAAAYARAVDDARRLSGRPVRAVHLVGGGALNEPLCRLTADACGLPVLAGPVEATALGNVLVQARARGTVTGDLAGLRALVRRTQTVRRYDPRPSRPGAGRR
jgi:rhamnulokinase